MAETTASQRQTHHSDRFHTLELKTESFERGPRYKEYAARRESRLRMKHMKQSIPIIEEEGAFSRSSPKKQVKFLGNLITPPRRTKGSSVLAQSVPDFSSTLRKENRKPPPVLPSVMEKSGTSPVKSKCEKYGVFGKAVGSKSANSGEKQSGGFIARKSYANLEEIKGLASQAKKEMNLEGKGMKNTRVIGKNGWGYRQF